MEQKTLKTLSLRIKREFLHQIANGEKKEELRTVCNHYYPIFVEKDDNGQLKYKDYDIIHLYVGNIKNSEYLKAKIIKIGAFEYKYKIPKGRVKGDRDFFIEIGEIIEKNF